MEYIIDDKGNNLKFVINKKIHCQKTRQCIFNILTERKSIKDEISAL